MRLVREKWLGRAATVVGLRNITTTATASHASASTGAKTAAEMEVSTTVAITTAIVTAIVTAIATAAMLLICYTPVQAQAETVARSLQELVDQADPGATIELASGTYAGPVTIRKPLKIRGVKAGEADEADEADETDETDETDEAGEAVLLNEGVGPALTIEADGVHLSNLRIVDEAVKDAPTVLVTGNRVVLQSLRIATGSHGIAVRDADGGEIAGTTIEWAAAGVQMADKGNGIDLFNAHDWVLADNEIRNVHDGIYMEKSDNASVSGNLIEQSRYGIHCMYTKGALLEGNTGHFNVTGAMVMASRQATVRDNRFRKQSEHVNSQGILLYDVQASRVEGNESSGNRVGLYVEQSQNNQLVGNLVQDNFIGIQLLDSSENTITDNRFIGNVADAQARNSINNAISGNYWDSFQGIDVDGDGKSNIPYAVNPFFQGLVQKRPPFQLFFQSPGMAFLEGLYQGDRELWATDTAPLMVPGKATGGKSSEGAVAGLAGLALLGSAGAFIFRMRRRLV